MPFGKPKCNDPELETVKSLVEQVCVADASGGLNLSSQLEAMNEAVELANQSANSSRRLLAALEVFDKYANPKRKGQFLYLSGEHCFNMGGNEKKQVAFGHYNNAVQADPECVPAYAKLTLMSGFEGLNDHIMCMKYAKRLVELAPHDPRYYNALAESYTELGEVDEAIEIRRAGLQQFLRGKGQDCPEVFVNALADGMGTSIYAFFLNYSDKWSRDDVSKAHLEWGRLLREALGPVQRPVARDRAPDRRLKIGYISAEFFSCVLMGCVEPILEAHSREGFHITCYQCNSREDKTTERLRSLVDGWINLSGMQRQEAVDAIRRDECDILVDLDGHLGGGRLDIIALRPAPILVSWIGYPNTTGLDCVDYRLTDDICDTPQSTQMYSEELVRLPDTFFNSVCRKVCLEVSASPDPPIVANGHVTFGSFNALSKHSESTKRTWARVMISVECKMLLKAAPFLHQAAKDRWTSKFLAAAQSITDYDETELRKRLRLESATPSIHAHCKLYDEMDIMLDSWPFSGHITTVEALMMGVPVITLSVKGENGIHSQNVSASILERVGLSDLVAHSEDEFVAKALALSKDRERLRDLKATLRDKILASVANPHPKVLVAKVEDKFREFWHRYLNASE